MLELSRQPSRSRRNSSTSLTSLLLLLYFSNESSRLGHAKAHRSRSAGSNYSPGSIRSRLRRHHRRSPGQILRTQSRWLVARRSPEATRKNFQGSAHQSGHRGIPLRDRGLVSSLFVTLCHDSPHQPFEFASPFVSHATLLERTFRRSPACAASWAISARKKSFPSSSKGFANSNTAVTTPPALPWSTPRASWKSAAPPESSAISKKSFSTLQSMAATALATPAGPRTAARRKKTPTRTAIAADKSLSCTTASSKIILSLKTSCSAKGTNSSPKPTQKLWRTWLRKICTVPAAKFRWKMPCAPLSSRFAESTRWFFYRHPIPTKLWPRAWDRPPLLASAMENISWLAIFPLSSN